ncbi:MAG: DUF1015 family protein [Elusimicrobiota bacterium]
MPLKELAQPARSAIAARELLAPFAGLRFGAELGSGQEMLCLPYDCLTPELEAKLRKSSLNAIYLEEPKPRLSSAFKLWSAWKKQGFLTQDVPSYYLLIERFEGRERIGLLAMIRLSKEGRPAEIWPHERCYRRFIELRKRHFFKMRFHLSPIFLVAEDKNRELAGLLSALALKYAGIPGGVSFPASVFDGVERALYPIGEPGDACVLAGALKPQDGFLVADGHHRFSAACELAQEGLMSRTLCYVTSSKSGAGLLGRHPPVPGRKALKGEPPGLEEIIAGAKEGRLLARKTTYFWPKIPCGLVYSEL